MKPSFFLIMLFLLLGMNVYVIYRLVSMLPRMLPLRIAVLTLCTIAIGSFFLNFFARRMLSPEWSALLMNVGYAWLIGSVYFFLIFILLDVCRLLHVAGVNGLLYRNGWAFAATVGLVAAILWVGNITYRHKKRVELQMELTKPLPAPLTVVALSDLHLGYNIGEKELTEWIGLINKEKPDIVLIAGDLVDNAVQPLEEQRLDSVLRGIHAKYGVYAAPGNHDYFDHIDSVTAFTRRAGIHMLRDDSYLVDSLFYVVGREDRHSRHRQSDLSILLDSIDTEKPIILLDHQPYDLDTLLGSGVDLQISGHTHEGQVWPLSWIVRNMYEKAHGYLRKGETNVYVSSGIGLWGGKYRIGTRSEYVVIKIKGAASDASKQSN
ncbi:MAG: metallophosphoesterase [Prevotellaceae bacterium]|jgi:predicted MPP superfamily phosphohydrolase|nr:metallophosphoesterase [Prevotellaceae bacterium]